MWLCSLNFFCSESDAKSCQGAGPPLDYLLFRKRKGLVTCVNITRISLSCQLDTITTPFVDKELSIDNEIPVSIMLHS
jgi:hypothetical protein